MKTSSELLIKCYQNMYQNSQITEEDLTKMVQKNQITELEKQEIISGGSTQPDTEKEELNEFYTSVIKEVGIE
jgi:Tfp pilus assembly PilM family ATPase